LTVVGATGSIGSVLTKVLAPQVGRVILVARNMDRLQSLAEVLKNYDVDYTSNVSEELGRLIS